MNEEKPNKEVINLINELSWPLNSEVVGRKTVNEKTPNKHILIDKDALRKKILQVLDDISEGKVLLATYYQVNLGTKKTRESIASIIVDEL